MSLHGVLLHSTSGASEMIFMNCIVRSSRVTGPKMRVPIGSSLLRQQHRGVAVEADQRAVGPAQPCARAHDHGVIHLALLDAAARDRVLDRDLDDVADAARSGASSRRTPGCTSGCGRRCCRRHSSMVLRLDHRRACL